MAQKLPGLRVVVARELRQFPGLAHIVQERDGDQKITVDVGINTAVGVAQVCDTQRVLAEAAHKSVVDALGGRGHAEILDERLVLLKKRPKEAVQILVLHGVDISADGAHHIIDVLVRDGHVVAGVVFPGAALARLPDVELKVSLEGNHVPRDLHVIQLVELADPHAVGIPDLCVDRAGLVLQGHALVGLAVLGHHGHSLFAQIDVPYVAAVIQILYETHICLFLRSLCCHFSSTIVTPASPSP